MTTFAEDFCGDRYRLPPPPKPVLVYSPDRAGSAATIARLRAELAERPTHQDVLDAAQTAFKAGFRAGVQKGYSSGCGSAG